MKRYEGPNRRRVFRLRLPDDAMLSALINGQTYNVIEVAEFSIVVTTDEVNNELGVCEGTLRWSNGSSTSFSGEIGRLGQLGRVIWNVSGIQMKDVIGEQRRLLLRYPATDSLRKIS